MVFVLYIPAGVDPRQLESDVQAKLRKSHVSKAAATANAEQKNNAERRVLGMQIPILEERCMGDEAAGLHFHNGNAPSFSTEFIVASSQPGLPPSQPAVDSIYR
jgi:hypothetical protein